MTAKAQRPADHEQARELVNTMRVIGGLLLLAALLLYFFHLAESPMGKHALGVLSVVFAIPGAALLWTGWRRMRSLR